MAGKGTVWLSTVRPSVGAPAACGLEAAAQGCPVLVQCWAAVWLSSCLAVCLSVSSAKCAFCWAQAGANHASPLHLSPRKPSGRNCATTLGSWYSHNQTAPSAGSGPPSGQALQLVINHHHRSSLLPALPPAPPAPPSLHLLPSSLPEASSCTHPRTLAPTHPSPPSSNACLVCRAHPPALVLSALPLAAADWPAPGDPSAPSSPPKAPLRILASLASPPAFPRTFSQALLQLCCMHTACPPATD